MAKWESYLVTVTYLQIYPDVLESDSSSNKQICLISTAQTYCNIITRLTPVFHVILCIQI